MAGDNGTVQVNYQQVNNVGDLLESGTNAINVMLNELHSDLMGLGTTWMGQSRVSYGDVKQQWDNDVHEMYTILQNANATLAEMTLNYKKTDSGLAYKWDSLRTAR